MNSGEPGFVEEAFRGKEALHFQTRPQIDGDFTFLHKRSFGLLVDPPPPPLIIIFLLHLLHSLVPLMGYASCIYS